MSTLDEVKLMQQQGIPEDKIIKTLQEKGISYREISDSLAQSKIKAAVEQPASEPNAPPAFSQPKNPRTREIFSQNNLDGGPEAIPGMQQSMMQSPAPQAPGEPTQEYIPTPYPQDTPQSDYGAYQDPYQQGYDQYDPYTQASGVSPDTITEISEQVVAEKMMELRKHLEKVTDFKTVIETKTEAIEERLRRLEETIHALQSSVLRKVGDYITNVDDIKKELIQTQQSFSKLVPELKKHSAHKTQTKHRKTTHKKKKSSKKRK
jgi:DNA-binding transcriptional MerR regulator